MKNELLAFTQLRLEIIASTKSLKLKDEMFAVIPLHLFGKLEEQTEAAVKLLEQDQL